MSSPCKGCEERELGCHAHCIAYRRWKSKHDKIVLQMHEDLKAGYDKERRLGKELWGK